MQAECLPEEHQKEVENAQVDSRRAGPDEVMPIYNGLTEEFMISPPIPYNLRLKRRSFLQVISKGINVQVGARHISAMVNYLSETVVQ